MIHAIWGSIKRGYLKLADPIADWAIRKRISPNEITTLGTFCAVAAGTAFAMGHIRTGGWMLGLTAVFDVLDGEVARRSGKATRFGAFYDSTLDRVADGALLGGLLIFFASDAVYRNVPMVVISLLGIIGAYLTSYTRARAEPFGVDAKIGMIQRAERIVLLAVPQALFGVAFHGYVLMAIVTFLTLTSWVTVAQRIAFIHRALSAPKPAVPPTERPGAPSGPVLTGDRVVR